MCLSVRIYLLSSSPPLLRIGEDLLYASKSSEKRGWHLYMHFPSCTYYLISRTNFSPGRVHEKAQFRSRRTHTHCQAFVEAWELIKRGHSSVYVAMLYHRRYYTADEEYHLLHIYSNILRSVYPSFSNLVPLDLTSKLVRSTDWVTRWNLFIK